MICIDNKYALPVLKFTNFYLINHNFSYFSTKTSYVTGSILNWGVVRLTILHTLMQVQYNHSTYEYEINLTQNLCKLTENVSAI